MKCAASVIVIVAALTLPACNAGHLNLWGYTTEPPYDCNIQTVYVPIPQNVTFRRGLEFELKRAIDREIESKTPYRVTSNPDAANTELVAKIISRTKNVINFNQNNEVRDAETTLAVEVLWRDLRAGRAGDVVNPPPPPGTAPLGMVDVPAPLAPVPMLITAAGNFIPELGGSITTAEKQMIDRIAVQIVSMMERPW
jgi:hypothetical protein